MPVGIFSSGAKYKAKANPCLEIDPKKFAVFLHNEWKAVHDALLVKEASKLIGYSYSTIIDWIRITDDCDIDQVTAKNWLRILETLGIVFYLHPYSNNVLKRTIKTPKLYFYDGLDWIGVNRVNSRLFF